MKKTIGLGKVHDGLYFLQPYHVLLAASPPSFDTWNWQLGHLAQSRLVVLSKDFPFIIVLNNCKCIVCPLAKQSRLPFYSSTNKTYAPFQLIHCDLWGQFSIPSSSRAHYFLTIVHLKSFFGPHYNSI